MVTNLKKYLVKNSFKNIQYVYIMDIINITKFIK